MTPGRRWRRNAVLLLMPLIPTACSDDDSSPKPLAGSSMDGPLSTARMDLDGGSAASGSPAKSTVLECAHAIGTVSTPPPDYETVLDVVALPTADSSPAALQTARTRTNRESGLYAKAGLLVRARASSTLTVPEAPWGRMTIGWGSPPVFADEINVPACGDGETWRAFAGGFQVSEVGCFPVEVASADRSEQVMIGIGAECPGQLPPPTPTET